MFSLDGQLSAKPGLRVRPVPEWDACVVYDPERRRLTELNLTAALVLELCDGSRYSSVRDAFARALGSRLDAAEVDRLASRAVMRLLAAGLLVRRTEQGEEDPNHG